MPLLYTGIFLSTLELSAQTCPPNIDFENGNFSGWTCYTGFVSAAGGQNTISLTASGGPAANQQTMFNSNPSSGIDPYGGFPVNCPNGSGHSIKLGNNEGGGQAEGISYEFTIPANQDVYSLIYHYAVVFQDPNHQQIEQPRMEIEITNVTDNTVISCASFTFIPYGTVLPGFFLSSNPNGDTPVWCKDWTAVSVNLDGNAGKTIRLFFKTADCTFRRHFGYAYIDVNSECSGEIVGAAFCPDDTAVNILAPYGYQSYTWYNSDFSLILGSGQSITLTPPPSAGTNLFLTIIPYNGYGCPDTLSVQLIDTLTVTSNAGGDALSCNKDPVQIGALPKAGLVYDWFPTTGLNDPLISNPFAGPDISTSYILTTRNSGGGCVDTDTVLVNAVSINNTMNLIGSAMYCVDSGDSTILVEQQADSIQWYRNDLAISGANQTRLRVTSSGNYHAVLFNEFGCTRSTEKRNVLIERAIPPVRYPLQYAVIDLPLNLNARNFGTSVLWNPSTHLNNSSSYTPVFQGATEQLYLIEIRTQSGCLTVDTQLVKTVKNVEMYVPTAFTPNNDGLNDYLRPTLMGIKQLRFFRIYNRWGQLLYEMSAGQQGWDGTIRGTKQASQVVVWFVEGIGVDGKSYTRKGTSVLIR
jgi:gliding motility-associated-like protein